MFDRRKELRCSIVSSGYASGPAQALVEFLRTQQVESLEFIQHPLVAENPGHHIRSNWRNGVLQRMKITNRPNHPPFTYLFDFFSPLIPAKSDLWFSFNVLATAQGLFFRRLGRTSTVIHWSVDFVPRRFEIGFVNWVYKFLDKKCCELADFRIELSQAAFLNRNEQHGLDEDVTNETLIVPMGFWGHKVPVCEVQAWHDRKIVFLGHLVERMGLDVLLDACKILIDRGTQFSLEIIGTGPLNTWLVKTISEYALEDRVTLVGFVRDHDELAGYLSRASIGVAPYSADPDSFTRFADPGKLKDYLGAGLPIVLTDVPPNTAELVEQGGAEVIGHSPDELADAIENLLDHKEEWMRRRASAMTYRLQFDWSTIMESKLRTIMKASG